MIDIDEELLENLTLSKEFDFALSIEKEFTKQVVIVQISNIIKIGACVGLAIYFQHWWIVIVGLFLQQSVKRLPIDFSEGDTKDENK